MITCRYVRWVNQFDIPIPCKHPEEANLADFQDLATTEVAPGRFCSDMISQDQRISGYLSISAAVFGLDNTTFECIQDIQQTLRQQPARSRPGLQVSPALQCICIYSSLFMPKHISPTVT